MPEITTMDAKALIYLLHQSCALVCGSSKLSASLTNYARCCPDVEGIVQCYRYFSSIRESSFGLSKSATAVLARCSHFAD